MRPTPTYRASGIVTVSAMASHLWGRIHATRAFAAVEQGDPDRAVRSVRAAAAAAARYGDCPTCSALLNPMAAEAFALLGDPPALASTPSRGARRALFDSSAWRAMAESAAGSVAVADGDADTAARASTPLTNSTSGPVSPTGRSARCGSPRLSPLPNPRERPGNAATYPPSFR